jgi:hypothetical protein
MIERRRWIDPALLRILMCRLPQSEQELYLRGFAKLQRSLRALRRKRRNDEWVVKRLLKQEGIKLTVEDVADCLDWVPMAEPSRVDLLVFISQLARRIRIEQPA